MKTPIRSIVVAISLMSVFGSCTVQDHLLPASSQGCRIVEEFNQRSMVDLKNDKENLIIDGQKVEVGIYSHQKYEYDDQGRISKVDFLPTPIQFLDVRTDRFEYPANQVVQYISYPGRAEEKTTYPLNEYGNTLFNTAGYKFYYDSEGFIVKSTFPYSWNKQSYSDGVDEYTIKDGNIVKKTTFHPQSGLGSTMLFEYDLTRPNLPRIYWFYAKASKNLPTRTILYYGAEQSAGYYETVYEYTFDSNGQVKRTVETEYQYSANGEKKRNSVQVTDYTISCTQ